MKGGFMFKWVGVFIVSSVFFMVRADEVIGGETPDQTTTVIEAEENGGRREVKAQHFDFGAGFGLDYGGIVGIKTTGLLAKHLGIFASGGFYLFTFGWNLGVQGYFLPTDTKTLFRPYAQVMYGVNCGTMVVGASEYNKIYFGFSPGFGTAFRFGGTRKHGFDVNLSFPIKDKDFKKQIDRMNDDPMVSDVNMPLPVLFSIGYHLSI